ncbi:hypothetical protein C2W58_03772 [Bacillus pumilus]|uniref:Uncharacterized protein n=1 Tax=Bacillus pumilus TaxID=1408 RepID=A0AB34QPT7_BACPU|nr:hypothetical protein B4127_3123 [Bacillus pumilus]RAP11500.1 hypothetical protein C2W58_03772 [Bacillus pumilus]
MNQFTSFCDDILIDEADRQELLSNIDNEKKSTYFFVI